MNCTEVHLAIGAEPQAMTPALDTHLRDEPSLRIIPLENLSAEDIAAQLKDIFGLEKSSSGQAAAAATAERPERQSRIAARLHPAPPKIETLKSRKPDGR